MMNASLSLIPKTIRLFFILFFTTGALISGLLTLFYQKETLNYVDRITNLEKYALDLQEEQIKFALNQIISDLMILRDQNELNQFFDTHRRELLVEMAREHLSLAEHSAQYDQIRFLDIQGMEVTRVNYNNGSPTVVPQSLLQPKAGRYYFDLCSRLDSGEVYISPFDLNIEKEKIEIPHKPMIRFCTPVVDNSGAKHGVVVLNYLGSILIKSILSVDPLAPGSTMLLNSAGYWLIHPDPTKEWGFMQEETSSVSFAATYPDVWRNIMDQDHGKMRVKEGLFTFTKVKPLTHRSDEEYAWYLVSMVPERTIALHSRVLLMKIFFLGAGIFILAAIGSWALAYTVSKRKLLQTRLLTMAYFDNLTGLPNRRHFFDRLEEALSFAARYQKKTALLYIDLDGFKEVNNTLGHDAGDSLLKHVAACLKQVCRKSDTVARLGGDEFAILIPRYENIRDIATVAAKIIAVLAKSYVIGGREAQVGASIGIAFAPQDSSNKDELVKMADSAMYYAKGMGKNQYLFFSDTVPEPSAKGEIENE